MFGTAALRQMPPFPQVPFSACPCLDAPSQLLLLARREHGRTIPLVEMGHAVRIIGPVHQELPLPLGLHQRKLRLKAVRRSCSSSHLAHI